MKEGIHPGYQTTSVVCSCGNRFETRSTSEGDLHVELCNQCHPFFTGQQKFVDTGGRVQRFSDKFGSAAAAVLEKEAADKEARRKAAEEAAAKAKQERDAKAAEKAAKAAKFETKAAKAEAPAATEATEGEAVPETTEVPGADDMDAVEVGPEGDDTAAEETAE